MCDFRVSGGLFGRSYYGCGGFLVGDGRVSGLFCCRACAGIVLFVVSPCVGRWEGGVGGLGGRGRAGCLGCLCVYSTLAAGVTCVGRGLLGRVRVNSGGTLIGGEVVARCVCGNDSAVASLSGRVSLDMPAIAGFVSRVYRSKCVGSCNGLRADNKERPGLCKLGPRSNCFVKMSVGGFTVGVKLVGFGKSVVRLGVGVPCRFRGSVRKLGRLYGLVTGFVGGLGVGGRGVLGVGMGMSKQMGPRSNCDFDRFGFRRHPLTSILARGLNCGMAVSGSAHTVACKRCVRKYMGKRGGVVFIGID